MADEVTIKVSDSSGSKVVTAKVPSNVPMKRLLPALVKKIGLPDGQYKAFHKRLGKNLGDDETLAGADVKDDDVIRLLQDVVAGR